jgi:hypothetical protein
MQQSIIPNISSVNLIGQDILIITFNRDWVQEDAGQLCGQFLSSLAGSTKVESISGADRESVRFTWKKQYFSINFECYSQSSWVEGENAQANELLIEMSVQLI